MLRPLFGPKKSTTDAADSAKIKPLSKVVGSGKISPGAQSLGAKSLIPNAKPSLAKPPSGLLRPKIQPLRTKAKALQESEIEDDANNDDIDEAEDISTSAAAMPKSKPPQVKKIIAIPKLLALAKATSATYNQESSESYPTLGAKASSMPLLSKAAAPAISPMPKAIGQRVQRPADRNRLAAIGSKAAAEDEEFGLDSTKDVLDDVNKQELNSAIHRMEEKLSDFGRTMLESLPGKEALRILLEAEKKGDKMKNVNTFINLNFQIWKSKQKGKGNAKGSTPEASLAEATAKSKATSPLTWNGSSIASTDAGDNSWSQSNSWTESWGNEELGDSTNQQHWAWSADGQTSFDSPSWQTPVTGDWNDLAVNAAHWGSQLLGETVIENQTSDTALQSTDTWDTWDESTGLAQAPSETSWEGTTSTIAAQQNWQSDSGVAQAPSEKSWEASTNTPASQRSWQADSGSATGYTQQNVQPWAGWGQQGQQTGEAWHSSQFVLPHTPSVVASPSSNTNLLQANAGISAAQIVMAAQSNTTLTQHSNVAVSPSTPQLAMPPQNVGPRVVLPLSEQSQLENEKPSDPRLRFREQPLRQPTAPTQQAKPEEAVTFRMPLELDLRLQALRTPLLAMPDISEVTIGKSVGIPFCSVLVRGARKALDSVQEKLQALLAGGAVIVACSAVGEASTNEFPSVLIRGLQDVIGHGGASVVLAICGKVMKWQRLPNSESGERAARCLFESPEIAWKACRLLNGRRVEERLVHASIEEISQPLVDAWHMKRAQQLRQGLGSLDEQGVNSVLEQEADSLRPRLDAKLSMILTGGKAPPLAPPPVALAASQGTLKPSHVPSTESEIGAESSKKKRGLPKPLPSPADRQGRAAEKGTEKQRAHKDKDKIAKSRSRSPRHKPAAQLPQGSVASKPARSGEPAEKKHHGASPHSKSGVAAKTSSPLLANQSDDDAIKAAADAVISAAADAAADAIGWDPYML